MQIQTQLQADADHTCLNETKENKSVRLHLSRLQLTRLVGNKRDQIKGSEVQANCVCSAHQINTEIPGELHSCRRKTNQSV